MSKGFVDQELRKQKNVTMYTWNQCLKTDYRNVNPSLHLFSHVSISFQSPPKCLYVFRWPLTLRSSERSKFPRARVAACPALSTLQAERFLWMLPTFRRRKRPSSVGPTTRRSPSLHTPLKPTHRVLLQLLWFRPVQRTSQWTKKILISEVVLLFLKPKTNSSHRYPSNDS